MKKTIHIPVFLTLYRKETIIGFWITFVGGKGVIPYEMIKTFDDIDCAPEGESFTKTEFYSSLRNKIINNEEYENVKDFWCRMCLKKLMPKFPYNPRKCTLDSSLSGCIHR